MQVGPKAPLASLLWDVGLLDMGLRIWRGKLLMIMHLRSLEVGQTYKHIRLSWTTSGRVWQRRHHKYAVNWKLKAVIPLGWLIKISEKCKAYDKPIWGSSDPAYCKNLKYILKKIKMYLE